MQGEFENSLIIKSSNSNSSKSNVSMINVHIFHQMSRKPQTSTMLFIWLLFCLFQPSDETRNLQRWYFMKWKWNKEWHTIINRRTCSRALFLVCLLTVSSDCTGELNQVKMTLSSNISLSYIKCKNVWNAGNIASFWEKNSWRKKKSILHYRITRIKLS